MEAAIMATQKRKPKREAGLSKAAEDLIRLAEEGGVEQNFFFQTTFNRYKVQLDTLTRLQKEIQDGELLISKEYVKGRKNLVANPAITEYNKTSTAANQTVQTLIKIITTFADGPVMNAAADDEEML
jgi:tRNA(Phe) wybutosine-synthesizing methylase Tyw3